MSEKNMKVIYDGIFFLLSLPCLKSDELYLNGRRDEEMDEIRVMMNC